MSDKLLLSKQPRPIGMSGLSCFPIAFGCWRFPEISVAEIKENFEVALDIGIDHFDSADIYGYDGNKMGNVDAKLGEVFASSPGMREKMILATKGGINPGVGSPYISTKEYLIEACERSLKQLRTDYVDLYYIHRPDLLSHPEETAAGLTALKDAGKIRHIAVSNYTTEQVAALQQYLDSPIVAHQIEMSPYYTELMFNGITDQLMQHKISPIAWSPLAGGRLVTGNTDGLSRTDSEKLARVIKVLDILAEREEVDRACICMAFLLAHPSGTIPILGTTKPSRIRDIERVFDVKLTRADWYGIVEANQGFKLP